jgi:hypothetical protein
VGEGEVPKQGGSQGCLQSPLSERGDVNANLSARGLKLNVSVCARDSQKKKRDAKYRGTLNRVHHRQRYASSRAVRMAWYVDG